MLRLLILLLVCTVSVRATTDEELEAEAWKIVREGMRSPSVVVRGYSLMAAAYSQDAYGVELVAQALSDRHVGVRQTAAELAARLRDGMLAQGVLTLLKEDSSREVRLAAMRSAGAMRLEGARETLERLLDSPRSSFAERSTAAQALSRLHKGVTVAELERLAASPRRGMRLLATALAVRFQVKECVVALQPLLSDPVADVRASAAAALALLNQAEVLRPLVDDDYPVVSCIASWATGSNVKWINDSTRSTRLLAIGALAAQGAPAIPELTRVLKTHPDPYMRLNAAIGLVRQRAEMDLACTEIETALTTLPDEWGWREPTLFGSFFAVVAPTQLTDEGTPDFFVRLELFNLLAVVERPGALAAVRSTLTQRRWGFGGSAAFTLLSEGDHSAVDLLRPLLLDSDPHVRLQAAIVLVFWGQDAEAIRVLQEAYPGAERFLKERILEGLGGAHTRDVLPFLVERLKEPYPTLRIIAASSLLNVINH